MEQNQYEALASIDVKGHVEKKGKLDYLSWATAWHLLKQRYPNAQRKVYEMPETGLNYFTDGHTAYVKVGIEVNGLEHIDYLPVMDYKNKAIQNPDAFAINTAKMRCLTKCLAMFGLGHYIYAGEDIPSAKANESIDQDQCAVIYDLLEKTGSDIEKFLKAFKIDSVEGMPSNAFDKAFGLLQRKMKSADK